MKRIMILAQDRAFASEGIQVFKKFEDSGQLSVDVIVSERSYYEKVVNACGKKKWLDNEQRNSSEIKLLIQKEKIDALISLQHRWIIPEEVINAVQGFAYNIHFGKLPDYRGHHTYNHAILNGDKSVAVTLHWIIDEVDRGFTAYSEDILVEPMDTAWSLYHKALGRGLKLLERFLTDFCQGKEIPRRAIEGKGHFYGINSIQSLKEIVSADDFDEIDRKSRAFYFPPHEPAYIKIEDKKFYIITTPYYDVSRV